MNVNDPLLKASVQVHVYSPKEQSLRVEACGISLFLMAVCSHIWFLISELILVTQYG